MLDRPEVAVVGLGLIGGSLALALVRHGFPVTAYDADPQTLAAAGAAGIAVVPALRDLPPVDLAVVAVPLPAVGPVLAELADTADSTVVDVASVKQPVRQAADALASRYVGAHPMAGTAQSGFAAARADLLTGAPWVVTLEPDTSLDRWIGVADLVSRIGGRVVPLTAAEHDDVVAWVSHLPHVLAETLAAGAADPVRRALAAGSFRDATRVAGTRPELVEAMLGGNSAALHLAIDTFIDRLDAARSALSDADELARFVRAGHDARDALDQLSTVPTVDVRLARDAEDVPARLLAVGRAGGWLTEVTTDALVGVVPV